MPNPLSALIQWLIAVVIVIFVIGLYLTIKEMVEVHRSLTYRYRKGKK